MTRQSCTHVVRNDAHVVRKSVRICCQRIYIRCKRIHIVRNGGYRSIIFQYCCCLLTYCIIHSFHTILYNNYLISSIRICLLQTYTIII